MIRAISVTVAVTNSILFLPRNISGLSDTAKVNTAAEVPIPPTRPQTSNFDLNFILFLNIYISLREI